MKFSPPQLLFYEQVYIKNILDAVDVILRYTENKIEFDFLNDLLL